MSYVKFADKWHEVDQDAEPIAPLPHLFGGGGRGQHVLTLKCCGATSPALAQFETPIDAEPVCDGTK